jgi:uncharacterized protein (DUF427 family)
MPSAKVMLNGKVLAESNETILIEGSHYFPPDSINQEFFAENDHSTVCHWKGVASYFDVAADGKEESSAAWTYHDPSRAAERIKDYVAFYGHQVEIDS